MSTYSWVFAVLALTAIKTENMFVGMMGTDHHKLQQEERQTQVVVIKERLE